MLKELSSIRTASSIWATMDPIDFGLTIGELHPSSPPHFFVGNVIMHDPFDCGITLTGNLSNMASATWLISQETWSLLIRMSSPHISVMISVVFLLLLDRDWISITVSSLPIIDLSLPWVFNPFWVLACDLTPASKNLHQYMAAQEFNFSNLEW